MNRYRADRYPSRYRVSKRRQKSWGISIIIICFLVLICGFTSIDKFGGRQNKTEEMVDTETAVKGAVSRKTEALQSGQVRAPAWNLRLVNKSHPITSNHPINITLLKNDQSVDARIYRDLQDMMDAARSEGLSPLICSSYRTAEKQKALYEEKVVSCMSRGISRKEAERRAAEWVAPPGTSEHELGLAVDIVAQSYQALDKGQEETPEQQWLMEHCSEYGFILRYPTDKSEITGIGYEPWHYRYVGKEAAEEIMQRGICLEEYLQM